MTDIKSKIDSNVENNISSASLTHMPPPIFCLHIDCLHAIFEWLSLNELTSMALTCIRMHHAVGDFVRSNYVSKPIFCAGSKTIYMFPWRELDLFIKYIPRISINSNNLKMYYFIGMNCKSIKRIRLTGNIFPNRIDCIKNILKHTQTIDLIECPSRLEFYTFFLQFCTNVSSLSIKRSYKVRDKTIIIGSSNEWMLRKYPTLKHLELTEIYELKHNELLIFFQQNPNVQTFATDSYSLWDNRYSLLTSTDIKLNKLSIDFINDKLVNEIIDVLVELHELQFFKHLHIYSAKISQTNLMKLLSSPIRDALDMIQDHIKRINGPLLNVRTLSFPRVYNIEVLETGHLPCNLPNIERIYFTEATTDTILPFICKSSRLTTIKIKRFLGGSHYVNGSIDLLALNEEREKLNGAKRITIYVNENLILLWRWKNHPIRCKLIELRRFYSHEWPQLNSNYRCNHLSDYSTF